MIFNLLTQILLICILALANAVQELLIVGEGDAHALPLKFRPNSSVLAHDLIVLGLFCSDIGCSLRCA
jgi:hypothetical protein